MFKNTILSSYYPSKIITLLVFTSLFSCSNQKPDEKQYTDVVIEALVEDETVYEYPDYTKLGFQELPLAGNEKNLDKDELVLNNYNTACKRLKEVNDSLPLIYKEDTTFVVKQLNITQNNWDNYFASMHELKYPKTIEQTPINARCINSYKLELTKSRIYELNIWMKGSVQGEICNGSVRVLDYSYNDVDRSREKIKQKEFKESQKIDSTHYEATYQLPEFSKMGIIEKPFDGNQTQIEMNNDALVNYNEAMNRLHVVIDSLHILYKKDPVFITRLDNSQKIWNKYFKSMYELRYPPSEMHASSDPLCENSYLGNMVKLRIYDLDCWLKGSKRGDDCNGSVRKLDRDR